MARYLAATFAAGTCFLLLSYLRILGDAGSAAFGGEIINAALPGPVWGTKLGDNLVIFAIIQILLHWALALTCLCLGILTRIAFPNSPHSIATWCAFWFVAVVVWIFSANAFFYPWSSLGEPYVAAVSTELLGWPAFIWLSAALGSALLFVLIVGIWRALQRPKFRFGAAVAAGTASVVALGSYALDSVDARQEPGAAKPHVILPGLDSFRPDFLESRPESLPSIRRFASEATLFTDVTTPLARTFPSWVSIITGRHPHTTGAVINLLPRDLISTGTTLPEYLRNAGYRTVYAIDEVRFSNLDTTYGFDQMVTPSLGATDFLLGFFGDAPLSNLVTNTRLGRWLFPYLHGNRAAAKTYYPETFVSMLDSEIRFDEPTFLAVHLTLAHWPYTWADSQTLASNGSALPLYEQAIARLDRQFAEVIKVLERKGALDNAVVVVLSDHGESLGDPRNARAFPHSLDVPEYEEERLAGHGTSVFGKHQYKVLLAFRRFGAAAHTSNSARIVDVPASLEDVAPTILDTLGIQTQDEFDGISLAGLIDGTNSHNLPSERIRFIETEFNPRDIAPNELMHTSALVDAASYYRVDPVSDRVEIRAERLEEILNSRQYAALRRNKMVVAAPRKELKGPSSYSMFVVVDEGKPVELGSYADQHDPEVGELLQALKSRFPQITES